MGRRIRIVVGEGRTAQQGLLRFVLEGEGFEVARETRTVADLAIAVAEEQPDVVVLDDGIGVVAVSMVHEAVPRTKIVLVWPSAVVPIGGDARVEPAKILNDLGRTVREVLPVGVGAGLTESFDRPDWIDRIRKDPATLRDKLGASGTETAKRPSVTQLQKRGRRLHPGRRAETEETAAPAAVVALPVRQDASGTPPEEVLADDTAPDAPEERSEWNRRLGTLALSGAAAVSALVLALALGGGRMPPQLRGAGEIVIPPGTGFGGAPAQTGPFLGGVLGSDGYSPIPIVSPTGGDGDAGPTGDGTTTGGLLAPTGGSDQPPADEPVDGGGGGNGGGGNGGGGNGGGGHGGGGNGGGGNGGGGGHGGGGEVKKPSGNAHNPFGGSPSKLGLTPAHGQGLGRTFGAAADNAKAASHAHKH
ncbi:MAG TPA: hypothetical protein VF108_06570 [Actinomycetota bacterium]